MRSLSLILLLTALCLLPALALAENTLDAHSDGDAAEEILLPGGIWTLTENKTWLFITQNDVPLSAALQAIAQEAEITVRDGYLPAGSALTVEELALLYPGAGDAFAVPETRPALAPFALTGEWYYSADGVLYYRHEEGAATMTVDEVFAALNGDDAPAAQPNSKIIYLTIDDTPSQYTMELLATLDKLDVKATFFVVGAYVKSRPVFLRAIYEQGHVIANHSYNHNDQILQESYESCLSDFKRCENAVADALRFPLDMPILRVPYGVATIPQEYRSRLQKAGYTWIDWNALNGDTEPDITTDQKSLDRAIDTAARYDGPIVMLVHDGKKRTIRTLPDLVAHFHAQGYEFRVLEPGLGDIPNVRMGLPIVKK